MSQAIFPTLAGLTWDVLKTPLWSTRVQQSVGGKEIRAQYYATPLYRWRLSYELLRANAVAELQSLAGFFNARQGKFDSFLFSDPNDNAVSAHGFALGDGSKTAFQLQRTVAGPRQLDWSGTFPVSTAPRSNYVTHSNAFAAWWGADSGSAGVSSALLGVGPDGSLGVETVVTSNPGDGINFITGTPSVPGRPVTFSIWLRALAATTCRLVAGRAGPLDDTALVVNVTTAWQRFSVTSVSAWTGASNLYVAVRPLSGAIGVDVFGAQLEPGTVATAYLPTVGSIVTANPSYWPLSADGFEPVLDTSGQVILTRADWQGAQRLYPFARTNLLLRSQNFVSPWSVDAGSDTIVATGLADPAGGTSAGSVVSTTGTDGMNQVSATPASAGQRYTFSIWLRAAVNTTANLVVGRGGGFDLTQLAVNVTTAWQRFSVTSVSAWTGTTNVFVAVRPSVASQVVQVFGGQLETGSTATAYLATTTTTVTLIDYVLSAAGLVTMGVAPLAAALLSWTGSYYWRVRFDQDAADFSNFLYQLWELKQLTLVSVR